MAALTPAGGSAQYTYLDSNGNGIPDAGDRLRSCTTRIDVWLNTSTNRDGSPASCGFGSGALSMSHYEFVLHAVGGTVIWGPMTNLVPGFTVNLARDSRDSTAAVYYHNGWSTTSSVTAMPPGLRHVATLSATIATGSPRIDIIARHPSNGTGRTSYGTECPATPAYDHTSRLGVSWTDVDGLAEAVASDEPPAATAPGIVLPQNGTSVSFAVTASDADADPIQALSANLAGLPPGSDATFSVIGLDTPSAAGTFAWTPTASDSGDYTVTFVAGNCLGSPARSTIIHVIGTPTAAEGSPGPARDFLAHNFPNPFHPRTEIAFSLARAGPVRMSVFTVSGVRIRTLIDGSLPAGPHRTRWNGTDDSGRPVASGVYWYRLDAGSFHAARRMILLR